MRDHETDSAFVLPAVDQPASTETGVILAGLDTDRLLAGLGIASLGDDPTMVTLLVDQLRHGGGELTVDVAQRIGARRWHTVRPALGAAGHGASVSGSVRQAWAAAVRVVDAADIGALGPAGRAYLAACWLRHDGIDELAAHFPLTQRKQRATSRQEKNRAVSEVTA
ncbi:MAG TPA: DUF6187 family protein [Pseudonocardiaceae bacterium]|jgi:hypothetical protein